MWPALVLAAMLAGPLADNPIGTAVARFEALTSYQVTLVSRDRGGGLLEEVTMEALQVDVVFPAGFFDP